MHNSVRQLLIHSLGGAMTNIFISHEDWVQVRLGNSQIWNRSCLLVVERCSRLLYIMLHFKKIEFECEQMLIR